MSKIKQRRGPKPTCPWNIQLQVLKEYKNEIFYDSGKVKELVQHLKMWKDICKDIRKAGFKIKPETIQNNVAQDRGNLQIDLLKELQKNEALDEQTIGAIETNGKILLEITVTNALEILLELQNDALLKPILKEFSPYRFCQSFWSNDAIRLTKLLKSGFFLFGAVGAFTENFSVPEQFNSETIISYSLGIFSENDEFVPLFHIMLENDIKTQLKKFFSEVLRAGCPPPSKILLDYRNRHIKAATESFNINYNYEKYLTTGLLYLTGEPVQLPRCQIIVDIGIILQIVKSSWVFQPPELSEYLEDFFVDAIKLLHSKTSLHDFEESLKKILVLTTNQFESDITTKNFEELQTEFNKLSQENCNCNSHYKNVHFVKTEDNLDFRHCREIIDYLKNLYKESCQSIEKSSSERKNSFYNIVNTDNLLKLCIEFVTWTHVIDDSYCTKKMQSSTSALQVYRDVFKSTLSDTALPLKIDDYIKKTISFTENNINNTLKSLSSNHDDCPLSVEFKGDDSYLTYTENWMGLNNISEESEKDNDISDSTVSENSAIEDNLAEVFKEKSIHELINEDQIRKKCRKAYKPKKRGPLLEPCADFFVYMKLPKKILRKRSVIKNANSSDLKTNEFLLTTSVFDSICEVSVSSFHLIYKFQTLLQNQSSNDFFSLITEYSKHLKLKPLYQQREQILKRVLHEKFRDKLYWKDNLAEFVKLLITPSIKRFMQCLTCDKKVIDDYCTLPMEFSDVVCLLKNIQPNLLLPPAYCTGCGCSTNTVVTVNNYLFIDVEKMNRNNAFEDINTLPLDISLGTQRFALTGIVGYKESLTEPYVRHYLAHCLKSESINGKRIWQTFDDTCKRYQIQKKETLVVQPAILIYIEYDAARAEVVPENDKAEGEMVNEVTTLHNQHEVNTLESESLNADIKDTHDMSYIISTHEQMYHKEQNSSIEIGCTDKAQMITSTPDNSAIIISSPDTSAIITSTPDKNQMSNSSCETKSVEKIGTAKFDKSGKNILKVDLENATLPDDEKYKTTFSFDDINKATLSWEQPQKYSSRIIANANSQGKIKFKIDESESLLKFTNTCGYDSITETIKHCCATDDAFRQDIEQIKTKNDLFNTVRNYAVNHNVEEFYFGRAKSMFIRVPTTKKSLLGYTKDCKMNLCSLFRETMSDYPSIIINGTCICGEKQERMSITNSLNYKTFFDNGISRIGNMLEDSVRTQKMFCLKRNCYKQIEELELTLGNYIAFDLELMYESKYQEWLSHETGKCIKKFETRLQDIPQYITLFNSRYSLKAVIEFQEITLSFLHYVAYCRSSSSNRWTKYDDTSAVAKELTPENLPSLKISLILYTAMRQ